MTDNKDQDQKSKLRLSRPGGKLGLKQPVGDAGANTMRGPAPGGRSKTVTVEVKRKRTFDPSAKAPATRGGPIIEERPTIDVAGRKKEPAPAETLVFADDKLTSEERGARLKALEAARLESERKAALEEEAQRRAEEEARIAAEKAAIEAEIAAKAAQEAADAAAPSGAAATLTPAPAPTVAVAAPAKPAPAATAAPAAPTAPQVRTEAPIEGRVKKAKGGTKQPPRESKRQEPRRRPSKITITKALEEDEGRMHSLASIKRRREKEKLQSQQSRESGSKVIRDVIVPETIAVQELANRMAERSGEVIKSLMKMGVMATINQVIDADTAELIVEEFGHNIRRISDADVEQGAIEVEENESAKVARSPVVTVMGHVDHGKTSLLDALRKTDVAAGEAGGITQHIGAYQVEMTSGDKITFVDTPGHAAFTEMRARGANTTDIVILVVAADDGVMPQTIEAISHAKAADVPIIVAVNKIDKPDADPTRVYTELLQHELVVEQMSGDVLAVPVSAIKGTGLDKIEEAIMLQAELLELKADPTTSAQGVVVEAKLEKGRGSVATVLVQKGTCQVGDIFVAGKIWGRVRALVNYLGEQVEEAGPSTPIEVLGLNGTPQAGDDFVVVANEAKAREIAEFRTAKARDAIAAARSKTSLDQMFSAIQAGEVKDLPVIVKSDVQGSLEAISGALEKLGNDEVNVQVIHAAVGGITESDITLAKASEAIIIGFNVRANPLARDIARRDAIDIRYYSIIYEVVDDVKAMLSGLLKPEQRENFLGYAEILEVFQVTKVGKVAGCKITSGLVKRGSGVRLLRDNVVVHEGKLKTLRRFKDEVREVKDGYECGMAFENYDNIQVGDQIECFEVEEIAREL